MPDTPVTPTPFIPVKPQITIGPTGSAVDIACAASDLAVEVDQDTTDWETFCGKGTIYGPELWTITVTVYPSYGADGLWNLLRPLVGAPAQQFTILPDSTLPAGPDNPSMTGTALVKSFPFYVGAPGEPKTFDIELAVQGTPSWVEVVTAAASASGDVTAAA